MKPFNGVATRYLPNYIGWRRMLETYAPDSIRARVSPKISVMPPAIFLALFVRRAMSHPKQLIETSELVKLVKYSSQHIARPTMPDQFSKRIKLGQTRGEERFCRDREAKNCRMVIV